MKKNLALLLAVVMVFTLALTACSKKDEGTTTTTKAASDLEYIKEKGTLVVGITEFEPMDYKEEGSDEWVGFDADMAREFAKSIGVNVEFVIIDWDNKAMELSGKSIDCVWNGMTLTDEVKAAMSCSNAYCDNAQVVIVPKADAEKYKTIESVKALSFAVEAGSAGEKEAKANGFTVNSVLDQASALMEVNAKTSDAAVIDALMAAAMVGEGTGYPDLTYTVHLNSEEYGVGFRKGSDVVSVFNDFLKSAYADGSMMKTAEKYGVDASIIEQK